MIKQDEAQDVWGYVDWLYSSGRLVKEEHDKLTKLITKLEVEVNSYYCEGC